jgi:hypothetical protein
MTLLSKDSTPDYGATRAIHGLSASILKMGRRREPSIENLAIFSISHALWD